MKKSCCLVLLLLWVIACRAQQATPYVKLALNLLKGSTYYTNTTANVSVVQTINGRRSNITTTLTGRIAFTVTGIHDSLYTMEARYTNLSLKMQLPTGALSYTSDNANTTDPVSKAFAAFKNQPIDLIMTRSGRLRSLNGIDPIFDRILAGFLQLPAEEKLQIKSMMEQSFGERAFRSNLEMGMVVFPSVPVKKGVFWVIDSQLQTDRPADAHTIYELREIADTYYFIHGNGTIAYENSNTFVETNGVPLKYNLSGFIQNDIRVDKATGWIKESRVIQTISGDTQIKDNPKTPGGMTIPMSMRSDMTITDK